MEEILEKSRVKQGPKAFSRGSIVKNEEMFSFSTPSGILSSLSTGETYKKPGQKHIISMEYSEIKIVSSLKISEIHFPQGSCPQGTPE
ncbi:hypothetical protein [Slackia heliotrinireducens]|uniref:hypothetical protein n=1 Tax=Slackia heliotrinireducens TaxID=84110 RepID=UPI003315C126